MDLAEGSEAYTSIYGTQAAKVHIRIRVPRVLAPITWVEKNPLYGK